MFFYSIIRVCCWRLPCDSYAICGKITNLVGVNNEQKNNIMSTLFIALSSKKRAANTQLLLCFVTILPFVSRCFELKVKTEKMLLITLNGCISNGLLRTESLEVINAFYP